MDKLAISYFNTELPSRKDWAEPEAWGPLADPAPALAALSAWTGMVAALYEALSPSWRSWACTSSTIKGGPPPVPGAGPHGAERGCWWTAGLWRPLARCWTGASRPM
ncbi:MAG: hypothetical protein ACLSAF_02565 [Intestinimonas sp.]